MWMWTPDVYRLGGPLILTVSAGETHYLQVSGFVTGFAGATSNPRPTTVVGRASGRMATMTFTQGDGLLPTMNRMMVSTSEDTPAPITLQATSPTNAPIQFQLLSAPVAITVEVTSENDAPIALGSSGFTGVGQSTAIVLMGSDAEGSSLVFSLVELPMNGSLTGSLPNLTYVPRSDFVGIDTFTFRTYDGTRYSPPATMRVFVGTGEPQ